MRRRHPRRIALVALATLMLIAGAMTPVLAQNLLRNGGFEQEVAGDAPQGWAYHDFSDGDLASGEVTRGAAFGKQCLQLQAPSFPADYAAFCLPVDVDDLESDEIFFSCFYRTEEHPQAVVTLAAYAQDFTAREFQTPELHSESHPVGETKNWKAFTTRMEIPPGAQQVVVYLRVMGGGKVWWDGVNLRPVSGDIQADLEQSGIIERLPDQRAVRCRVRNTTERELPVRMEVEASLEGNKRIRRGRDEASLAPGQERELQVNYRYGFDEPHDLRVTLVGDEPDTIYALWERSVPGLIDARVTEPAFRSTIISSVPTEHVVVEGALNTVPEIARATQLEALIVGTGEPADDIEALTDDGYAGPWRITLPADGMLTQQYIVHVTATVDGREQTVSLPVTRAPHAEAETAYDAQGRLWVNGEPIFPVGIYRVAEEDDLPTVAEAGFNFVITPSRQLSYRYAAAAHDVGTHVILSSDTLDGQFWEYVAKQKYYGNPAMIGWNGIDLPDTRLVTYNNLYQAYRKAASGPYPAIAEADPHRPIFLALRPNSTINEYATLADVVMAWTEPVPEQPITVVADAVRAARKAVGNSKPVWAVIQTSGQKWISELSPTLPPEGRPPTAAEHRAMVYLALMSGADGLAYYSWALPSIGGRPSYYLPRDEPDLWAGVQETNRQLEWLAPALLNGDPTPIEVADDVPLRLAEWEMDGSRVVVAVNTEDTTAAVGFDVNAGAGEEIEVPFENRCIIATDGGEIGDIFAPYAVHIYRIGA